MTTRVALVTGAAQGIGEAICLRLADEGIDIALLDIPSKQEQLATVADQIAAKGRKTIILPVDVTSEQEVKTSIAKTVEALGSLDIMVANAGIMGPISPMLEVSIEDFRRVQAVNVEGVFFCYKYAAQQMNQQGRGGRIIGAASVAAKRGAPRFTPYTASKFAVRGLTQVAAQEFAPHNITVNAYAPGMVMTSMSALPEDEKLGGHGQGIKKLLGLPADMVLGKPSEVAELVAFLIKPEAQYITGQSVSIDGGMNFD
ncbi:hypothetical protein NLI96_g3493 [Meripilus lineatus]|uniref:Uncharacterized protein n=1 Tax=Meripilus lineatus TaxID=2056292 RepID=A0AAD5YGJ1_9APHY|nr:hypothetical protein NLI96_g3493 [Physisporinus lineatus]